MQEIRWNFKGEEGDIKSTDRYELLGPLQIQNRGVDRLRTFHTVGFGVFASPDHGTGQWHAS